MIGAMPAVAVRHERRKKKNEKSHRPNQLMLKPHMNKSDGTLSPLGSHAGSHNPSRAGSPTHGQHADGDLDETILGESNTNAIFIRSSTVKDISLPFFVGIERYGDECFYGKLSLLHFIIFFFLGGLTVLIVGAVQYKKEAGLFSYRHSIIIAGVILIAVGIILLIIKCICFRVPILEEAPAAAARRPGKP